MVARMIISLGLFCLAAFKVLSPSTSGAGWLYWGAWVAGVVECATAVLWLPQRTSKLAAGATIGIGMTTLIVALVLTLVGTNISGCGCFGSRKVPDWLHVVMSMSLVGIGVGALWGEHARDRRSGFTNMEG